MRHLVLRWMLLLMFGLVIPACSGDGGDDDASGSGDDDASGPGDDDASGDDDDASGDDDDDDDDASGDDDDDDDASGDDDDDDDASGDDADDDDDGTSGDDDDDDDDDDDTGADASPIEGQDHDGDSYDYPQDCDDNDPTVHPGAEEVCNGIDDNCRNGEAELELEHYWPDADGDGYGLESDEQLIEACEAPEGYVSEPGDCDDENPTVHPGAREVCNGIDDNCRYGEEELELDYYWPDADGDGYGVSDEAQSILACATPEGYVAGSDDCDDHDGTIHPGASEICDLQDNDCDGDQDEDLPLQMFALDADGDGFGLEPVLACSQPAGTVTSSGDCNDDDATTHPGATEVCDVEDNDCDGILNEGFDAGIYFADNDKDGYGDSRAVRCGAATGFVAARGDCDDTRSSFRPGAPDTAGDGADQDCGGTASADPHVGLGAGSKASIFNALLAAKDGQTIWVGPGTWFDFDLDLEGRSITLASTHGAASTVIDGEEQGTILRFMAGETRDTVIDGFTITHAGGDEYPALHIEGGSPTIRGCILEENDRGAVFISGSAPHFHDTLIRGNQSHSGAAVWLQEAGTALFTSSRLIGNYAASNGGGVYLNHGYGQVGTPTFVNCTFDSNSTAGSAGALYSLYHPFIVTHSRLFRNGSYNGGAVVSIGASPWVAHSLFAENFATIAGGAAHLSQSAATFESCRFKDNEAPDGGGVWVETDQGSTFDHCLFTGNVAGNEGGGVRLELSGPAFRNSIFSRNRAAKGGGLFLEGASPTLDHVVIVGNTATTGGGLTLNKSGSKPTIVHSIIAFNSADNLYTVNGQPNMTWTDLYNPTGTNHNLSSIDPTNLTIDPGFVAFSPASAESADDFHLKSASPLVNAGNPLELDADGSKADFGAYGGPAGGGWDLDGDGKWAQYWPGGFDAAPSGTNLALYDRADRENEAVFTAPISITFVVDTSFKADGKNLLAEVYSGQQVFLAGDFTGWHPNRPGFELTHMGGGLYQIVLSFPLQGYGSSDAPRTIFPGERIYYKFAKTTTDADCPQPLPTQAGIPSNCDPWTEVIKDFKTKAEAYCYEAPEAAAGLFEIPNFEIEIPSEAVVLPTVKVDAWRSTGMSYGYPTCE